MPASTLAVISGLMALALFSIFRPQQGGGSLPNSMYLCLARDKLANGLYVEAGGSHDAPAYRNLQSNVHI
jgi:hypothetical protein